MKARIYGIVGSAALLASFASACRKDPTASGVGTATEVILDFSALRITQGDSATIQAKIVDNRLTPLEGDITFSSCDGATASVTPDASFDPVPPLAKQASVKGVSANVTCITATAAGAKPDTVNVVVLPANFPGALSSTTLEGGTVLTITSTANLKFDPATVAVSFPGVGAAVIISATADAVDVLAPFGASPGPVTIDGVIVTYVAGLTASLPTASAVTVTGDWGFSTTTPTGGDTIDIAATANLTFSASTQVVHPGYGALPVISRSASSISVLSAYTSAQLTLTNVDVTAVPGLVVSMTSAASVQPTGDSWPTDDDWQTAPNISALLPASGSSSQIMLKTTGTANGSVCPENALGFGSTGPCMMFRFTLGSPMTLNVSTNWEGTAAAPDVDLYACSDSTVANFNAACFEDGGAGATGSKPQATGAHTYAAGDHWIVVEIFGGGTSPNISLTISRP